jgi:hypothetical protein
MIELQHPDAVVAALGDLAYESGTLSEFDTYYHDADPNTLYSWGVDLNDRVKPVPGNHEYYSPKARGYVDYFTAHGVQRSATLSSCGTPTTSPAPTGGPSP